MNFLKVFAGAGFVAIAAACGQNATADAATRGEAAAEAVKTESAKAVDAAEFVAPSGAYTADQGHRYITFTYDHQGYSAPFIRWRNWDANLDWNADEPEKSSITVTIDTSSIDTGVDKFDAHMKSADIFHVEKHPEIKFVSTAIEKTGANTGKITGDLTIKGTTKPVTVDAVFNKGAFDQRGQRHKLGFSGTATLLRSDFGVDFAVPFVGDEVKIIIETEFDEVTS